MAKRFVALAAVALVTCVLAACTSPTAPGATPSANTNVHHVNSPMQSAGTLIGSDT